MPHISLGMHAAGVLVLGLAAGFVIGVFIRWLIEVPHSEIQTDFETLKERNQR
jgi:hypothetical protein